MNRSKQITIAAVLLFIVSLLSAVDDINGLARGINAAPGEGSPFYMSVFIFMVNIAGMFAAFGLWQNARWGKILALMVVAIASLGALLPVIFAGFPYNVLYAGVIAVNIIIAVLILMKAPKPAEA